jgi:endonuclease I
MPKKICFIALGLLILGCLQATYIVNFEGAGEIKTAYAAGNVVLSGLSWNMTEALIGDLSTDWKNGTRSARLRGYGISAMTMLVDKTGGAGNVSFFYRRYGTDTQVDWKVEYSTDGGFSWTQTGPSFTAPATNDVQFFSSDINMDDYVRLRIKRATETGSSNYRLNIDDITLTDYVPPQAEIIVTGNLTPFSTMAGTPSAAQSYLLGGSSLTGNIMVSIPYGFEASADGGSSYLASLSLPPSFNGSVLVRMTGATAGVFGADIVHSSAGAADVYLPAVGTVSGDFSYATDLFISEYVEGSSNNKALEIFNGTGSTVDLSDYQLETYFNGSATAAATYILSGNLEHGDVVVIANSQASAKIIDAADLFNNGVINFNGDDAIGLRKRSTNAFVDIFGVIGNDPGSAWTGTGGYSTLDHTLVRKSTVSAGVTQNPSGTGTSAFTTLVPEWDLYPADTTDNLTWHDYEGGGGEVLAPTVQASGIVAYPANNEITLEWTPGNGAKRIVKVNTVNSFSAPVDGTNPNANPNYSGAGEQVVFNGATQIIEGLPFNGCIVSNLIPATSYWFRIYEYNGAGAYTRYLATSATGNPASATTTNSQSSGYYAGISGYGSALKSQLHSLIRTTHTTNYSYDALWTQLPYTDEDPDNTDNIIEIYTGWSVPKTYYGSGTDAWNREHTWSKSHGDFGDAPIPGTDLHHLRPCDGTVNTAKSNRDFDEGGTPYVDASPYPGYSGATGCYTSTYTWEPRDADKGDVARMIMYMAVRYEGTDTSYDLEMVDYVNSDAGTNQPYYGKLSTLLNWHLEDPPDAREMQRNNRIQERQGNRNPFIDNPFYAQAIWSPVPTYATNVSQTGFTANWSAPISATRYHLQVATDSLFANIVPGYGDLNVNLVTSYALGGLSNANTYYYRLRSYFLSGYSMYSPFLAVHLVTPVPTATLSSPASLDEYGLDGALLTLALTNTSFADATLLVSNFTLNGAPTGLSLQSVQYLGSTSARLILGFDGTDFDDNLSLSVNISPVELTTISVLTSSAVAVSAYYETLTTIDLQGGNVVLNLTPVADAVSYHVFSSAFPDTGFVETTASGYFDPGIPTRWTHDLPLTSRRFYRTAAIRD